MSYKQMSRWMINLNVAISITEKASWIIAPHKCLLTKHQRKYCNFEFLCVHRLDKYLKWSSCCPHACESCRQFGQGKIVRSSPAFSQRRHSTLACVSVWASASPCVSVCLCVCNIKTNYVRCVFVLQNARKSVIQHKYSDTHSIQSKFITSQRWRE